MRLSAAQLSALLEGLDWRRVHQSRRTAAPTAVNWPATRWLRARVGAPQAVV